MKKNKCEKKKERKKRKIENFVMYRDRTKRKRDRK